MLMVCIRMLGALVEEMKSADFEVMIGVDQVSFVSSQFI